MKRTLLLLATALLASACSSSHSLRVQPKQFVLHESVSDTGEAFTYSLLSGSDGVPSATRSKVQKFEVATLGVRVRSINQELAGSLKVHAAGEGSTIELSAWRGLLVNRVDSKSPASQVGLKTGDVLLTFDGIALSTPEQLKELLAGFGEPGSLVDLSILERDSEKIYASQATNVTVTLGTKQVDVTKTDTFPLESDLGVFRLTGLIVGTLPPELALEIYGSPDPVTLVAGALVGSPAYLAGLRSGDRVILCDGQPVTTHTDISRAVLARTGSADVPLEWFGTEARDGSSQATGKITLQVEGPLGTHDATLGSIQSIEDSFDFHIPILYDHYSDVHRTDWSFLDFIFQFGANYSSRYRPSSTRAPRKETSISFFPFGMFEYETSAQADRYRFFWLIRFEDKH